MSRQIQIRRGSATEHQNFTGAIGEITMDTTNNTLRVHDGETAGGTMLARQSELPPAGADYVIASQNPTAENNYTWYRKYQSGWVEQGGRSKTTTNASGDTIYFPVSVSASSFVGFSIIGSWNDSPIMYHVRTLNQTANSITVVGIQHLGTSTSRQTVNFYWYVTGPATE